MSEVQKSPAWRARLSPAGDMEAAIGVEAAFGVEAAIGMKDEIDFIDEVKGRVLVAFLINLQMLIHIWITGKLG